MGVGDDCVDWVLTIKTTLESVRCSQYTVSEDLKGLFISYPVD